jgi:hypothetical protein
VLCLVARMYILYMYVVDNVLDVVVVGGVFIFDELSLSLVPVARWHP